MKINLTCEPLVPSQPGPQDTTAFDAVIGIVKDRGKADATIKMDLGDHDETLRAAAEVLRSLAEKLQVKASGG